MTVDLRAEIIPLESWAQISADAHMACFGEDRSDSLNTFDFVVGCLVNEVLSGYFTCKLMDADTVYIQHGGSFPNYAKTIYVMRGYVTMLNALRERYKRAWTRIENSNRAMLKMAMTMGFKVVGTYTFKGKIFVELENDFGATT